MTQTRTFELQNGRDDLSKALQMALDLRINPLKQFLEQLTIEGGVSMADALSWGT